MIWFDREAKRLKERNLPLEWVDDMKTPSGRIHVGSLRGVIVHDLIYKALRQAGINTKTSYVFNNMDPMDGMPSYLDKNKWQKYMGMPLYKIPSPEPGFKSFADYFAQEFIQVFNSINCHPQIIWSSELHKAGKMNEVIRLILNKADIVRDIFKRVVKKERPSDWHPYNPICEKCGKIGTTYVNKWDGKYVYYRCRPDLVEWAKGCGHEGKVEPINENGKLVWKLDWPVHWKVIGITVESSGKDHMSKGGSYDMGVHFCKEILNYEAPDSLGGYEWFTIGGKKMSSSKGIGASAKEVSSILPPDIFRFFMVRTPIKTHLDFNPFGDTIPNLFDDYDRCLNAYFLKLEKKVPRIEHSWKNTKMRNPEPSAAKRSGSLGKQGEVILDFARIIELSEVKPLPIKRLYIPRFRTIANLLKNKTDLTAFFKNQKGSELTNDEKTILEERIKYAKIFLDKYAENQFQNSMSAQEGNIKNQSLSINEKQKKYLVKLADQLSQLNSFNPDEIQKILFDSIKLSEVKPKEAFKTFYSALTGKPYGPKASDLILKMGIDPTIQKLKSFITLTGKTVEEQKYKNIFQLLNNKELLSIDEEINKKIPSLFAGIAVIRGVNNQTNNLQVNQLLDEFIDSQANLSTEDINSYPEIQSYRKILKFMGIDYHSRRPAPEALLRRLAQKKDLYKINTVADIFNIVAMKYKMSGGVYDYETIKNPMTVRFAKQGEQIQLFGDKEPTAYVTSEIAWFDQIGGFINFGYRDAQRTAVTKKTRDVLITLEGVFAVNREIVEKALKTTIDNITKYCGGKLEVAGIVETGKTPTKLATKVAKPTANDSEPKPKSLITSYNTVHIPRLSRPDIFTIDPKMAQKYPSINIGIALIKGVIIKKNHPDLRKEIDEFLKSQAGLNNEIISSYPEIQSYRKIYKEMGLDWHSKRPSPEALLRRIALKKGLYNINTCVDAYNLIVMKYHVSSGAFDLDKIKFPTVLRFPEEGEKILLLGDDEPTEYKPIDLAYFDQNGGYNIYFNYRDAQRTAVTEQTKNILLNIDGIYDITRNQVEKTLKESIEIITKYCGGKVELAGIVSTNNGIL
ncbi:lysine--tRNA ligase [Candidatus Roizmanbacteria bacterium RIFCSPHIGHO2_01_FULL_35_10]|uniref:Lysine--tRNA ligase n=1 Tax=Candidatus Roizmanbacteria bacterium RIFCSPLOWO2_01_FULL_35_13 TaxID=1802055 RepID=A0A1F7I819_9BACT|nr:MAG: lysine--tRNA ligase [Candidatus Roizmanbacteria bacterium RIFCSPHIGHO2_01_FULL_35_10]OGK39521.1 MAG: lysine--tRNA ligase [Candidatus Roizmanbacteria bacterium RIFCSPLOWO2_01_FULL_35_13]